MVRKAGFGVRTDFDSSTVKVEGHASMTVSEFRAFALGLNHRRG